MCNVHLLLPHLKLLMEGYWCCPDQFEPIVIFHRLFTAEISEYSPSKYAINHKTQYLFIQIFVESYLMTYKLILIAT